MKFSSSEIPDPFKSSVSSELPNHPLPPLRNCHIGQKDKNESSLCFLFPKYLDITSFQWRFFLLSSSSSHEGAPMEGITPPLLYEVNICVFFTFYNFKQSLNLLSEEWAQQVSQCRHMGWVPGVSSVVGGQRAVTARVKEHLWPSGLRQDLESI